MTRPFAAGVVFDLDGVLVDSEHHWEDAWRSYAADHGRTWTGEQTSRCQGMSVPEWSRFLADFVGDADAAQAAKVCVGHMLTAVESGETPLLPGAAGMVEQIADRVPIALATSAPRAVIDTILATHGLADRFTATVSSAEVPRGKPHPDVYIEAVRRLALPGAGDGAAAVEDSSNGIRAAHAAGLHVVAIPNPVYPPAPDALALADHVAADQHEATCYLVGRMSREEP